MRERGVETAPATPLLDHFCAASQSLHKTKDVHIVSAASPKLTPHWGPFFYEVPEKVGSNNFGGFFIVIRGHLTKKSQKSV